MLVDGGVSGVVLRGGLVIWNHAVAVDFLTEVVTEVVELETLE